MIGNGDVTSICALSVYLTIGIGYLSHIGDVITKYLTFSLMCFVKTMKKWMYFFSFPKLTFLVTYHDSY